MGIVFGCLFKHPEVILEPVVGANIFVIITDKADAPYKEVPEAGSHHSQSDHGDEEEKAEEAEEEEVIERPCEAIRDLLIREEVLDDDITIHVLDSNCDQSRIKAHLVERTGTEELPYIFKDGENLGSASEVTAMAETGELYKLIYGKDKPDANVSDRRPSVMDKFKFSFGSKKEKKRKTNSSITEELPPPPEEVLDDRSH